MENLFLNRSRMNLCIKDDMIEAEPGLWKSLNKERGYSLIYRGTGYEDSRWQFPFDSYFDFIREVWNTKYARYLFGAKQGFMFARWKHKWEIYNLDHPDVKGIIELSSYKTAKTTMMHAILLLSETNQTYSISSERLRKKDAIEPLLIVVKDLQERP